MTTIKKKELSLQFIWGLRAKLRAEGDKRRAEGDNLWAEGDKRRAEGAKRWAEAIIEVYGNITVEWKNWSDKKQNHECHLETGEVFVP